MAAHGPRLWWVAVALLLWSSHTQCREFTHEDIREAMLSLVHMIRMSEDKLERHEFREKALGEQLKKMLLGLDKKHRALEPLIGKISRLDERLSNVETILLQKEEREKLSQKKTEETLNNIQKTLQEMSAPKPTPPADLDNSLSAGDTVQRRLDVTDAKIDSVKKEIKGLKNSLSKDSLRAMCIDVASDKNPFEKHLSEAEKLLNKYELRLNEYNGTAYKTQTDFVPLNEVTLADEAWHSKMSEVMERQEKEVRKIQRLLSDAESMWKDLPRRSDLQRSTNQTLNAVSKMEEIATVNSDKTVDKLALKIREMGDKLQTTNEDIQQSLTQSNTLTERAYDDISRSYTTLTNDVQTLTKNKQMIIETHDNVIATKKRLEYGVNQILIEVAEIVRIQHKHMNKTVNERLDSIGSAITDNQTIAINNLTSKMETEMMQVWRQIGVMHQQIMMSKQALDTLTVDAQHYANTSATTMNKVQTDVSDIAGHVTALADNLNYALGQLSLETQEFKHMSKDLSDALNDITQKTNPTPKAQVSGPGPHIIPSVEKTN